MQRRSFLKGTLAGSAVAVAVGEGGAWVDRAGGDVADSFELALRLGALHAELRDALDRLNRYRDGRAVSR